MTCTSVNVAKMMTTVLNKLDSVDLSRRIWIRNVRGWPQCASNARMLLNYPDPDGNGKCSRCEDNIAQPKKLNPVFEGKNRDQAMHKRTSGT